jgi:hypothetical protein
MDEAGPETTDPSVRGVCIADLITRCIFAATSLFDTLECADRRALAGTGDIYAFLLIFYKLIADKRITMSRHPARPSLAQTAPRQSANS